MIFVRARWAAANIELLEDDSTKPSTWIVAENGVVVAMPGSPEEAAGLYSGLVWLDIAEALSAGQERAVRESLAKFRQRKRPEPDPEPEMEFGM